MSVREQIIYLLLRIENEDTLKRIYNFTSSKYIKEIPPVEKERKT